MKGKHGIVLSELSAVLDGIDDDSFETANMVCQVKIQIVLDVITEAMRERHTNME